MNLPLLGYVNAEGGPLLLSDLEIAREWHGVEHGGADYERACAFFDVRPGTEGGELAVGDGNALLWEMSGAGTAFVLRLGDDELLIVRAWLHDPNAIDEGVQELAISPASAVSEIGSIRIQSGNMMVLWATEDGCEISAQASTRGDAAERAGWGESAEVVARMPVGTYSARHEVTASRAGSARRLHVKRQR